MATKTGAAHPGENKSHDVSGEARNENARFARGDAEHDDDKRDEASLDAKVLAKASDKKALRRKTPRKGESGDRAERTRPSAGAMVAVGAAGVAVGVAAMIGRKVAVQAPTALAGDWDVALAAEHAAVIKIFDALENTTIKNVGRRMLMLVQLKHALGKHTLQEENVIYPALRDAGQVDEADALNHDHGYVKQYLYEMETCPKDSESFLDIVRKFRVDFEKHAREEEVTLFPLLKAESSPEMNRKLTMMMNKEGFKLA